MAAILVTAQTYLYGNNYEQAINELNKLTPEYYEKNIEAEKIKSEAITEYRSVVLQMAETSSNQGQYNEALLILKNAEELLPNDAVIASNVTNISNIVLNNYLNQAQNYANNNQYAEALNVLNEAEKDCGQNSQINTLRTVCINSYIDQIFFQAEQILQTSGYDEAYTFITSLYNVLGNNSDYIARKDAFTEHKPIFINDIDYFTGGQLGITYYNKQDNLGNNHEKVISIHSESKQKTSTYLLNGQYQKLDGMIFRDFKYRDVNDSLDFRIYVDGNLLVSLNIKTGSYPAKFDVPLIGANELIIEYKGCNCAGSPYHYAEIFLYK